ncbi:MAG: hypothetical protein Q7J47_03375 [Azoarcus sp.]|nr:hypothetical protein [Azoarcus sp.]
MTIPSMLDAAVKRLIVKEPRWKQATTPPAKGGKAAEVAVGRPASAQQSTGSAGSFVEQDYSAREHWPERTATTTDGIFTVMWPPTKKIVGEGGQTIELKEPT